jgi:peptide/nickel transport system ATP-binding protein
MSVLEVRQLTVDFAQRRGPKFRAVDHVSFELNAGETLALVGESGSGKSTIARAVSSLVRPSSGEIYLNGKRMRMRGRQLREYRHAVQMVFQDPFASLNPAFNVKHHLARPLLIHGQPRETLDDAVGTLLESVSLVPSALMATKLPHELSGGQRQRVAIARALAPEPQIILADEPVSMLDVSIRLEILNLLDGLKRERDLALLYITHDLATARHFSTHIMVMYRGEIVERGGADEVILNPSHPYTQLLAGAAAGAVRSQRQVNTTTGDHRARKSQVASAELSETFSATGCRFRARCPYAMEICAERPEEFPVGDTGHTAKCWMYDPKLKEKTPATNSAPTL